MTVKVSEILGKLHVLKDLMYRKQRLLKDETQAEKQHVLFLERNLAQVTSVVMKMRSRQKGISCSRSRRQSTLLGGDTAIRSSNRGNSTSLRRNTSGHRYALSSDMNEYRTSRSGSGNRIFSSTKEHTQYHLKTDNSITTLQKQSKNIQTSYLKNIYHKSFKKKIPCFDITTKLTEENQIQTGIHKHRKTTGNPLIHNLQKNRYKPKIVRLEQSRSSHGYTINAPCSPASALNIREQLLYSANPTPIGGKMTKNPRSYSNKTGGRINFPQKNNILSKDIKVAVEIRKDLQAEAEELFSKKQSSHPTEMIPLVTFSQGGLSKGSVSKEERGSLNKISLNLKRRETVGGVPNKPGFQSLNKSELQDHLSLPFSPISSQNMLQSSSKKKYTDKLINELKLWRKKVMKDTKFSQNDKGSPSHKNTGYLDQGLSNIESIRNEDTVRVEEEESDRKTEKRSSPRSKGREYLIETPMIGGTSQNIVIKEMSNRSDFESQSIVEYSTHTEN